jgi:aminopeptidase N
VTKPWESEPSIIIEPDPSSKEFRTWKFKAVNVHDFAWTADPTYRIGETKLKLKNGHEVSIISLAQEPHAAGWQDASLYVSKNDCCRRKRWNGIPNAYFRWRKLAWLLWTIGT